MPAFQRTHFGNYVLLDRIGVGGMAEIFLATARGIEGFEKRLVIKRILPMLSHDEQFVRMFVEEAKLCVALRHPNIVQVYDLGEIERQYFIAMEYVDGRDLLKTLGACGQRRVGFPTDVALYIVMEVLKGLNYAHQLRRPDGEPLGIIHRDVSPSNVLLSYDGEVKIGDFGIAKASTREKTATGILKGKFGYMAPEQVTGDPIDHKADIFAMGIVLYELLTGHRLFAGKNEIDVLERIRDGVIEPAPRRYRADLDEELEEIVLRALALDREARFASAGDFHDAVFDYVYRSGAHVGPGRLGQFMRRLFLVDPKELARRSRVQLPPIFSHDSDPPEPSAPLETSETDGPHAGAEQDITPTDPSIADTFLSARHTDIDTSPNLADPARAPELPTPARSPAFPASPADPTEASTQVGPLDAGPATSQARAFSPQDTEQNATAEFDPPDGEAERDEDCLDLVVAVREPSERNAHHPASSPRATLGRMQSRRHPSRPGIISPEMLLLSENDQSALLRGAFRQAPGPWGDTHTEPDKERPAPVETEDRGMFEPAGETTRPDREPTRPRPPATEPAGETRRQAERPGRDPNRPPDDRQPEDPMEDRAFDGFEPTSDGLQETGVAIPNEANVPAEPLRSLSESDAPSALPLSSERNPEPCPAAPLQVPRGTAPTRPVHPTGEGPFGEPTATVAQRGPRSWWVRTVGERYPTAPEPDRAPPRNRATPVDAQDFRPPPPDRPARSMPGRERISVHAPLLESRWALALFVWVAVPLTVVFAVAAIVVSVRPLRTPPALRRSEAPPVAAPSFEPERATDPSNPSAPSPRDRRSSDTSHRDAALKTAPEPPPSPTRTAVGRVEQTAEPPTPALTAPSRTPSRRPAAPRRKKARPPREGGIPPADNTMSTLRIRCPQPVDVRIRGFGRFQGITSLRRAITPGAYTIVFTRDGNTLGRMAVNLIAGQGLELACP